MLSVVLGSATSEAKTTDIEVMYGVISSSPAVGDDDEIEGISAIEVRTLSRKKKHKLYFLINSVFY
ncbi:hypothetical protein BFP72_06150 [Reichenbachiella sp. 5M10]|nr:hypothetical protein BFP72_06150 [Reichenbachiella sp. 5M10]